MFSQIFATNLEFDILILVPLVFFLINAFSGP